MQWPCVATEAPICKVPNQLKQGSSAPYAIAAAAGNARSATLPALSTERYAEALDINGTYETIGCNEWAPWHHVGISQCTVAISRCTVGIPGKGTQTKVGSVIFMIVLGIGADGRTVA